MFALQGEINASVINVLQDTTTYYVKQERVSGRSRSVFLRTLLNTKTHAAMSRHVMHRRCALRKKYTAVSTKHVH